MNNNEPNKIVSNLFKQFNELRKVSDENKYDYAKQTELSKQLAAITMATGAIEVMSKNNIIKLIKMQFCWRFMAHHSFYIQFQKCADDLFNNGERI